MISTLWSHGDRCSKDFLWTSSVYKLHNADYYIMVWSNGISVWLKQSSKKAPHKALSLIGRHLVTAVISSVLSVEDMERVGLRLRYCLPLLVCFFRCLHTSQGTVNYSLHFMFCSIFCLIWRDNSDQQSYANDKIIFVVIGYNKVRIFSNKGLHRESSDEMWMMNIVEETFSYLNISKVNSAEVQNNGECAFACLNEPMCFSYNLEASASKTGTRVCELLPSDKYNNSDKVIISQKFHHYSIQVSDLKFNIENIFTSTHHNTKYGTYATN